MPNAKRSVPQLFAYDMDRKVLSPKPGESPSLPIPTSLVAKVNAQVCIYISLDGAFAGFKL